MTPAKPKVASRRSKRPESFNDWMKRIDREVEESAREIRKLPKTLDDLPPGQAMIIDMLLRQMRTLPRLRAGEDGLRKSAYFPLNIVLTSLFLWVFPEWEKTPKDKDGDFDMGNLPQEAQDVFARMLNEAAGLPMPAARRRRDWDDDDDD